MFVLQLSGIIRNSTGIEDWILEKARHRRVDSDKVFIHPYSMGKSFNIKQVLKWHCAPDGDGIVWPVRDDCDQYTLTVSTYLLDGNNKKAREFE